MTTNNPSSNTFVTPNRAPAPRYPAGYYVQVEQGRMNDNLLIIDLTTGISPIPESAKERVSVPKTLSKVLQDKAAKLVAGIQSGASRKAVDHAISGVKAWVKAQQDLIKNELEKQAAQARELPLTPEDHETVVELTQPTVDHTLADGLYRATGAGPTDQPSPADFRENQPTVIYGKAGEDFRHTMKEIVTLLVSEKNAERRRALLKQLETAVA